MIKVKGIFLTILLSFFALFLYETNADDSVFYKNTNSKHDLKINTSFNTLAISTSNSFQELLSIDKKKEQPTKKKFFSNTISSKTVLENDAHYLRLCEFFELNLTKSDIIYPFHSFL